MPLHGAELYVVNHNGEPYTPMKPIVEGMGMVWAAQFVKLKQRFVKGISEIEIPSAGGKQLMICLAFRKFAAWLSSIQPNKVCPVTVSYTHLKKKKKKKNKQQTHIEKKDKQVK
ncbi:hypothetical protein N2S13_21195, partial [Escherichia coli]|nr:hypothetical protein [Escherichia coli]